jgi:hypothetical protein
MLAVAIPLSAQIQPPRYIVTDLGPVNGPFSQAPGSTFSTLHPAKKRPPTPPRSRFVAYQGMLTDIGNPGWEGRTAQRVV